MKVLQALVIVPVNALAAMGPGVVQASGHQFTSLDAPKAGTGPREGTALSGINQRGDIVGCYADRNRVLHGFLLHQGRYTVLDHPSAARVPGPGEETQSGTMAIGISERGEVVGTYMDSQGISHGFLWQ